MSLTSWVLFDTDTGVPDVDYYDDDDDNMVVYQDSGVDPNQPVAYLDQLNVAPNATAYSSVQQLSSQIAFLAPSNLFSWVYLTLGLRCSSPLNPPISFPKTVNHMGFYIDDAAQSTAVYPDLQEFVSYMCARDFRNPRLVELCDLHPQHETPLDLQAGGLHIHKVEISQEIVVEEVSRTLTREGYILTPVKDTENASSSVIGWILVIFDATSVVQTIRNGWGRASMETLVRHLVRHGVEFRTLVPAVKDLHRVVDISPQLANIKPIPRIPDIKVPRTVEQYREYVGLRQEIMQAPEAKPVFRMGGVLWRLAMETTANFDDVIDNIMDGPCDVGPAKVEYFHVNGNRFYDNSIPQLVEDTLCGIHGEKGCSYWPRSESWGKRRWLSSSSKHGNLMWNHRDEEWFGRRSEGCMKTEGCVQPIAQSLWKKGFPSKHYFDVPFEEYSKAFLDSSLSL